MTEFDLSSLPQLLGVIPVKNSVVFPAGIVPLGLGEMTSRIVDDATHGYVVAVLLRDPSVDAETPGELFEAGTLCRVVKVDRKTREYSIVVQGLARCRLRDVSAAPPFQTRMEVIDDEGQLDAKTVERIRVLGLQIVHRSPELPAELREFVRDIEHPGHLIDLLVANLVSSPFEKQRCLETFSLVERAGLAAILLTTVLDQLPAPMVNGTQCGIHGVPADAICARCGAFTCDVCRGPGGLSPKCRACRSLEPPPPKPVPPEPLVFGALSAVIGIIALMIWWFSGPQRIAQMTTCGVAGIAMGLGGLWLARRCRPFLSEGDVWSAFFGILSSGWVLAAAVNAFLRTRPG